MATRQIYLDHNATTPLHPEVKAAMREAAEVFGNPSSLHAFGRQARQLIEDARATVAGFIGAEPEEMVFVGSGSEANNTVLSSLTCCSGHCDARGETLRQLITSRIEHPCILEASKCIQEKGITVLYLDVDRTGKIDLGQLKKLLSGKRGLVSMMMANNETGTIQDIKQAAKLAHEAGALFHTDAVQAVGKIPVNVRDLGVDFLTLSGHKIYGPKGVGAIYVKKGVPFCPLIRGGHQEQGRRAGTENTIGIAGLGAAVAQRVKEMPGEAARLRTLRTMLSEGLTRRIPESTLNGHVTDCLAGTLNISFAGAEGEAILLYLDLEGIAVSTGSACASGSLDPSHVLLAMGLSPEQAHGSIRLSLGRDTTEDEVSFVLEKLPEVITRIRKMSTAYVRRENTNDGK